MKNLMFTLLIVVLVAFSNQTKAQTVASDKFLAFNTIDAHPVKNFNTNFENATVVSAKTQTAEMKTAHDAIADDEDAQGINCKVYNDEGKLIASCGICNCANLAEKALQTKK